MSEMDIRVQQTSGDVDEWNGVENALHFEGNLLIVSNLEGDEIPAGTKTFSYEEESGKTVARTTYRLHALYAPGMWMKVEFE